jgi:hypothetical protein
MIAECIESPSHSHRNSIDNLKMTKFIQVSLVSSNEGLSDIIKEAKHYIVQKNQTFDVSYKDKVSKSQLMSRKSQQTSRKLNFHGATMILFSTKKFTQKRCCPNYSNRQK